jgi:hypothetical protein
MYFGNALNLKTFKDHYFSNFHFLKFDTVGGNHKKCATCTLIVVSIILLRFFIIDRYPLIETCRMLGFGRGGWWGGGGGGGIVYKGH